MRIRIENLALLLFGIVVSILRKPDSIANPQFWAEDGAVWYADAYNFGGLEVLFEPHTGYLQVFSRSVAAMAVHLPFRYAPIVFTAAALLVHMLPAVLLVSHRFERVVPDKRLRYALAGLYFILPYPGETYLNLTNSHWRLLLVSFLLLISATPTKVVERVGDILLYVITGLSGPHVFFMWACLLVRLRTARDAWWRAITATMTVVAVIQGAFALSGSESRFGSQLGADAAILVRILGSQVSLGAFAGYRGVLWAYVNNVSPILYAALFLLLACISIHALVAGPWELKLYILLGMSIVAAALYSPMVDAGVDQWPLLQIPPVGARYWFHFRTAFIVAMLWGAWCSSQRWTQNIYRTLIAVSIAGSLLDFRVPALEDLNFSEHAVLFEQADRGEIVSIPLNPIGWEMRVTKR